MVFYYSATGNSLWAATQIAKSENDRLISITDEMKGKKVLTYTLEKNETLSFVFPVHAWNPPDTVIDFITQLKINGYKDQYVFALATCGDDTGSTMKVLEKALHKKNLPLNSKWEIIMPNNYLPMGDVDSPKVEQQKLTQSKIDLDNIMKAIKNRQSGQRLLSGRFTFVKTVIAGFFFRKLGKSCQPFHITEACTSCALCSKICLSGTISMIDGSPTWGKHCDQCFACINRCPCNAIQYGKSTLSKGRYCHSILKK